MLLIGYQDGNRPEVEEEELGFRRPVHIAGPPGSERSEVVSDLLNVALQFSESLNFLLEDNVGPSTLI